MGLNGYKFEEKQFDEDIKIADDPRYIQKKFLDYVIDENSNYFAKRNNRKYQETLDDLGNINEAINNPKKDKNGNDFYEISYENIFGFISTKKFKNKKDIENYRDKIAKKNKDYLKKIKSSFSSKNFESNMITFFTSGKCPDFTTNSYNKDNILKDFSKAINKIKDLFTKKESRVFLNESQLSPLHKQVIESMNNLNIDQINKIKTINLDENQIMSGLSLSLKPDELQNELIYMEENCFRLKDIKVNQEVSKIKDRNGNILNNVVISENINKDEVRNLIDEFASTNDLINKLPWYKKIFTSQEVDLKKKLKTVVDTLEQKGINSDLINIYVFSDPKERPKMNNILNDHIKTVTDYLASFQPSVHEYGEKLEKHNLESTISNDFKKLNKNIEKSELNIPDEIFNDSHNHSKEDIDDLELPNEITNEDFIENEDFEVESNKNFINNKKDIISDNDIIEEKEEINIFEK